MLEQVIPKPIYDAFQQLGPPLQVEKGTSVFHGGERAQSIYYILSGLVQISKETELARELTIRVCSEGNVIGEDALFSESAHYATTAKALQNSILIVVNQQFFEQYLTTHPALMLHYVKWIQIENNSSKADYVIYYYTAKKAHFIRR